MDLLAHVETFLAVADEGGFTRAAQTLELPQPLVSRRIRALERSWGGPLFTRDSRGAQPTDLGELALPDARELVRHAHRLRDAVARARASLVHLLAVPEGCPASALAAIISAGADRGLAVALRERSAEVREEAVREGDLAAALVRVPVSDVTLRVATGLAAVAPADLGNAVHLDALRPRRGAGPGRAPVIRVTPEDDLEPFVGGLRRAAARAGLPETAVVAVDSAGAGAAAVLADGGFLLCDASAARRHGLDWSPLADLKLHRGYELVIARGADLDRGVRGWLEPLLAAAVGAADLGGAEPGPGAPSAAASPRDRLVARGS